MKKIIFLVAVLHCFLVVFFIDDTQAVIYKYVNKDGIVCFADDLQTVPREYRIKVVIVEGEEKKKTITASGPIVAEAEMQSSAGVPEKQSIRSRRPFSFRLIISMAVSLVALLIFIILSKQVWFKENKRAESIARVSLAGIVSVYLIIAHANDVMTIFGFTGKVIDDIQQQSAEKGKKAAEAIKAFDAIFQEAQKAQESSSYTGGDEKNP